jgi:hypothetical protein
VALKCGDIDQAMTDLVENYPLALTTTDMPIIAAVGVSVGWLANALGRPADAATILGAAARLRGSEDPTEPLIVELTRELRAALGPEYDDAFRRGKALDRASAIATIDPAPLARWSSRDRLPSEQGKPAR